LINTNLALPVSVSKKTYLGIFFVALSTLMYEILLTRIFSVTMGYHFAFMAVSLAMFGMTVGAIIVYLFPRKFPQDDIKHVLAKQSMLFAITMVVTFLIHIAIPFIHGLSIIGFLFTAFIYITACIPFVFSGICVSLVLTRFTGNINKLYAADLIGAALGCILVVQTINISGGPTAVFICAFFTSLGSISFALDDHNRKIIKAASIFSAALILFSVANTITNMNHNPILRLYWIRGEWEDKPLLEKWNSFSRVSVDGDSTKLETPFAWGLSATFDRDKKVSQLMLNIDAHSTTVLSKFDGDFTKLKHLEYDVANITNYIRKNSDVMIIGSGAGRDVLSSLYFGQKTILGIEINKDMISAINDNFGNFTGHLDKYPNVTFVGDEARSYIQRLDRKFDIIQVSVIDNWSATSSGAFVLTENALYTLETWKLLFEHLKPNGIITVTRFYRARPSELYRLIAICTQTLLDAGIKNPREHLMLIKCEQAERMLEGSATGTIMLSKAPFTKEEMGTIDTVCKKMLFQEVLTPDKSIDSAFGIISTAGPDRSDYVKNFPVDITPPTDDKPFFFHLLKFQDILNRQLWTTWDMEFNVKAIFILLTLFVTMIGLTAACILIPLKITSKKIKLKGSGNYFAFFAFIGLGFMFVEISQIQRLNIFLGHPTYSIAAALFTLLLSSGIGSYLTGKQDINSGKKNLIRFSLLLIALIIFGVFTPNIITAFREQETWIRVAIASIVLFPLGLFMGMAFPVGMSSASRTSPQITPWLWGINGVTSVCATVISVIIAMTWGISMSYWTGFFCYLVAFIAFISVVKKSKTILPETA
jgi:MFS family permease